MKYEHSIEINLPRARVVELFDNVENLCKWMPGLKSFEHVSGEPGAEGAVSRLKYEIGKRKFELLETVTKRNLPDEFFGKYDAKNMENRVRNYFEETAENKTTWRSENEFNMTGFMKLIVLLMPRSFKKQSYKYMEMFKDFAEKEG